MLKNLLLPSFGKLRIERITPAHVTRLMKAVREHGYSSKYQLNLFALLRLMFYVARAYDLIPTNPVRAKLHRPVHERREKRSRTPDQIRALIRHLPGEYEALFFTAGVLGLRFGELADLQYGDLTGEEVIEGITYSVLELRRSVWRGRVKPKLKTQNSMKPMLIHPCGTCCPSIGEIRDGTAMRTLFFLDRMAMRCSECAYLAD